MRKKLNAIKINNSYWILLSIIILGTALRIYNLGTESLWYDEMGSIDQATEQLPVLFAEFDISPLYALFLKYWMRLFGMSEFSLRFPSVIFGAGSIFLLYKLGCILFNKNVGIISALIISTSPFHLFYSQEARNYILFLFLTLGSMYFFLKMLREESSVTNRLSACYVVSTGLLLYSHQCGIFVILIQNLFVFFQEIKQKKKWIILQAAVAFIFLIWFIPNLIYIIEQREYVMASNSWLAKPNVASLAGLFKTFSYGGLNYGGHDSYVMPSKIGLSPVLLYIFGAFSILGLFPLRRKEPANLLLGMWLFIPISILFGFSLIFFPLFLERYLIFTLPAYYLLIAKGINKLRWGLYKAGAVLIIVTLSVPALHFYYKQDLKIRWNEAFDYIRKCKKAGDIFIVVPARHITMFEYEKLKDNARYGRPHLNIRGDLGVKIHKGGFVYSFRGYKIVGADNIEQLKRTMDDTSGKDKNIWLVLSRWADAKEQIKIREHLGSFKNEERERHYEGVDIIYYLSDSRS